MIRRMKTDAVITDVIVVSKDKSCLQPIIVNFQNGQLKDDETNNMKCGLFSSNKQCGKTVLALSNGKIVYKGYRPDVDKEPMCTMLAIRDKITGKIKLIQAERWNVAPVLNRNLNNDHYTDTDKIATLNKQFGSKKVKRKTELHEKMKISGESVKELLEKTVSNVEKMDDGGGGSLDIQEEASSILPPCNREAINVADVYDINDIAPMEILKTLFQVKIESVETAAAAALDGKSIFFKQTLEYLKTLSNFNKKLAVLLYIDAVTTWLKLPIKDAKKRGTEICSFSRKVNDFVMEKYSVNSVNGRLRPNSIKDKGIIHCMILALLINDYSLDLELFATEIGGRISLKKMTDFARLICAVPLKDNKKIVVLKLPLPTPSLSTFTNRRVRGK
ncbi:uncharacterized protein LOC122499416 [Leptopilina heterotoma]|uniref:uncharacterized protein LOC122499416 n=1 Tax=Leptopilina heterotoma TaxID=63436 RepID=UPI001CA9FB65|nr:uncharacterized protein LOC122499416 [Leptopilina heterotoma]